VESRECWLAMSRILGLMSLNAVRLRVLKLLIIVSIVLGRVERKKEPLTLSNLNIFVIAFTTVYNNVA
jgi:hypothetical protein